MSGLVDRRFGRRSSGLAAASRARVSLASSPRGRGHTTPSKPVLLTLAVLHLEAYPRVGFAVS